MPWNNLIQLFSAGLRALQESSFPRSYSFEEHKLVSGRAQVISQYLQNLLVKLVRPESFKNENEKALFNLLTPDIRQAQNS